ncbi:condensation domain-containing protein [Halorientalis salina]|uniref:condensation domain-containing protein n=1 Tax=Halorientalis salina TaxID=2932266 RepID=UPI0010AD1C9B|nr:condensation domain-containing protein [Halorientalis salina]
MSEAIPFSMIEESVYHIEQKHTAWNIQAELETTTTIDVDRLHEAARTACKYHPVVGARMKQAALADSQYVWELPNEEEIDDIEFNIEVVDTDDMSVEEAQNRAYFRNFDLTEERPMRAIVYRGAGIDGGDRLMVSLNHAAVDGVGTLQFTQAVCQAYRGEEPWGDSVSFEDSRAWLDDLEPSSVLDGLNLLNDGIDVIDKVARQLQNTVDEPARIAEDRDDDEPDWGWRFTRRVLDDDVTEKVVNNRPEGVSVNDVFLTGQHLAIERWNEEHGKKARKISTMMPINIRPEDHFYSVAGMYTMFESIHTRKKHRENPMDAAREIAEQTSKVKERDRASAPYKLMRMFPDAIPLSLKQQLPELLRGPGERLWDTAMLTNMGKIPMMPSLSGEGGQERPWFTPPVWKGTPVGIGVATYGDQVTFTMRHRREVLGEDAAETFSDYFLDGIARAIDAA